MIDSLLSPEALQLIQSKQEGEYQIVCGSLLLFFQKNKRFPEEVDILLLLNNIHDISKFLKTEVTNTQLTTQKCLNDKSRTIRRFKQEIRFLFGFRLGILTDQASFITYCKIIIFPMAPTWDQAIEQAYIYFKDKKLDPYPEKQLNRLLTTAHHQFETDFFAKIEQALFLQTKKSLDKLLPTEPESNKEGEKLPITDEAPLTQFKFEQAELKIESILQEIQKYNHLKKLNIPNGIENLGSRKLFVKYYDRVLAERPSSLNKHKPSIRYAYLATFCVIRQQLMADTLTDLILKLLHRIVTKAENTVDRALKLDNKRVKGKLGTLLLLAKQSVDNPDGVVKEVIYPEVSKDKLTKIITDLGSNDHWYRNQVKTKALSLYSHNNRRIVWALMNTLEFDAELKLSPLLKAINFLKKINTEIDEEKVCLLKERLYDPILLKNLIPENWHPFVKIKTTHPTKIKINWNALELALFERFEIELPIKNIWIKNAYRYRNPKDDMPPDFDDNEDYYFNLFGLPKDVEVYIGNLKERLDNGLYALNESILENPKVVIKDRKKKGAIKITPFDPQSEPQNLDLLKLEVAKLWPNLHLIDILKEADFRIGFTKRFQSVASREVMNEDILRKRLLLSTFGIGSNTGLKRMSGLGETQESYDNLRYVKRRFITCQNVRFAIQDVVNAIHIIRDPKVWGIGTTSCASDSKKISVWDQNLLVEWHARYGGRGVMIYWHVDKKGLCIHSMIKSCSSSEVGSMIHGVLHHDTLMDISELSVDTHGQSVIGFAFSEIFSFDLLPRIKNINKQKLFCSSKSKKDSYTNLADALASEIVQWNKIRQYYREVVRYAAALKMRTVEPDVLMKCLSADNKSNPVYQALMEIGKASRTIFLCRYLSSETLRIDINDALNVVERVNGIMGFIFYGRLSEISSNNTNDQELSLLCLHLLQVCMVYINTILIQTALSDPKWVLILKTDDRRALSPLFHAHVNPYGLLSLDMNTRINIENHIYKERVA
ncbi:MAG: Tn3 family transposase [Alphaproteobacteria bacterium]|nr:Tn3 family transposase [Alphaproteobacteria bacterium]